MAHNLDREKFIWKSKSKDFNPLTLTAKDINELDPKDTGVINFFGIEFFKPVDEIKTP